jgi:hypothetical protein
LPEYGVIGEDPADHRSDKRTLRNLVVFFLNPAQRGKGCGVKLWSRNTVGDSSTGR